MAFQVEQIRADIRDFHQSSGVDKVIVLWTANTERFCDIIPGVNDSADNLLDAIQVSSIKKTIAAMGVMLHFSITSVCVEPHASWY